MTAEPARPTLTGLALGDPPERWEALGFSIVGGAIELAGVRLVLGAPAPGINGWSLAGIDPVDELDGLPTTVAPPHPATPVAHPNGATELDHVVVTTPDFDRTAAVLAAHGMPLRRIREVGDVAAGAGFRQGFRRLGPGILELVEAAQMPAGPARFWGLVIVLRDLGWLASQPGARGGEGGDRRGSPGGLVGEPKDAVQPGRLVGEPKDAVQPGRQIVTLKRAAGLGQPVAFMSPDRA